MIFLSMYMYFQNTILGVLLGSDKHNQISNKHKNLIGNYKCQNLLGNYRYKDLFNRHQRMLTNVRQLYSITFESHKSNQIYTHDRWPLGWRKNATPKTKGPQMAVQMEKAV